MTRPIIHLLSAAGADGDLVSQLGLHSTAELAGFVQDVVGVRYRVTHNTTLVNAAVDEHRGGRTDDRMRARDIERSLANDRVKAMVSLRGGAWFTRILPLINFEVLKKRRAVIHVFGFSELTTLINIVAGYPKVRAHYDLGPGFLLWGLRNYAAAHCDELLKGLDPVEVPPEARSAFSMGWAKANFKLEFAAFLLDMIGIIEGRQSHRNLTGKLVRGSLPTKKRITVVGGCLSVLVALLGSRHQDRLDLKGRWLALEDTREQVYRIDRYLAMLKLAGVFEKCDGLLIGDLHLDDEDLTDAVLQLLKHHIPPRRRIPIIAHCNFGHCYPVASLPINQPLTVIRSRGKNQRRIRFVLEA